VSTASSLPTESTNSMIVDPCVELHYLFPLFSVGGGDNRAVTITVAVVLLVSLLLVASAVIAIMFVCFYVRQKRKDKVCSLMYTSTCSL
jgi:hypothetical protein